MENICWIIKGVSGAGKSTRINCLLLFLLKKGFTFSFRSREVDGKTKAFGYFIDELKLLILGKHYEKDGKTCFQGFDACTGVWGGVTNLSDYLKENSDKMSVLIEGAGITDSFRFRPQFLYEYCGFKNIVYANFYYDNKSQYEQRIIGRSGKLPLKDAGWNKHKNFSGDLDRAISEQSLLPSTVNCEIFQEKWDSDVSNLGIYILTYYGLDHLIEEYKQYCKTLIL